MKYSIEIDVQNIEVYVKYFFFDFSITVNGREKLTNSYDSDHCWTDLDAFKALLEKGYAHELVCDNFSDYFFD